MGELMPAIQTMGGLCGALAMGLLVLRWLIARPTRGGDRQEQRLRSEGPAMAAGRDVVMGEHERAVPCHYAINQTIGDTRHEIMLTLQGIAVTLDRVTQAQEAGVLASRHREDDASRRIEELIRQQTENNREWKEREATIAAQHFGLVHAIQQQTQTFMELYEELLRDVPRKIGG